MTRQEINSRFQVFARLTRNSPVDYSLPIGVLSRGWLMRQLERAIDSTLTALEERRGSQSDLCEQLGWNLMSLADKSHTPSWQEVFFFADDITRELLGKHLTISQHRALRRCLCVTMHPKGMSNARLAAKLRKALANVGVTSKTGPIMDDFAKLREAIRGPDDTPVVHKLRKPSEHDPEDT